MINSESLYRKVFEGRKITLKHDRKVYEYSLTWSIEHQTCECSLILYCDKYRNVLYIQSTNGLVGGNIAQTVEMTEKIINSH